MVGVGFRDTCRPLYTRLHCKLCHCLHFIIYETLLEIRKNKNNFRMNSQFHDYNTCSCNAFRPDHFRYAKSKKII